MALFTQFSFLASGVRSLCWRGDELVDWVDGGRTFSLDGTAQAGNVHYAYRFDAAIASPNGRFAVIYERLGTKGLLLREGKILRELDRSFYYAEAYEYPITLFQEPGGQVLLAHCPREYNRIELEEAETGQALTASAERKPCDFFHSRLAASPNGKRLLSAGWVWQPWGAVTCFDIARGLADPHHFDRGENASTSRKQIFAEEDAACWLSDDIIAVSATDEPEGVDEDSDDKEAEPRFLPRGIGIYDLASGTCRRAFQLAEEAGTILAIGPGHVLSLYRHPKLIDLMTGEVLHVWTELHSGLQGSSIIWGLKGEAKPPPMAFDSVGKRFAIANDDTITVIVFDAALSAQ
jgi:hypothetical protein